MMGWERMVPELKMARGWALTRPGAQLGVMVRVGPASDLELVVSREVLRMARARLWCTE
jgi:hypothetical protein